MKRSLGILTWRTVQNNHIMTTPAARLLSTKEVIERRYHLFTLEKKRQLENVGRIEKIEVNFKGVPKDCTLIMNKDISTPYDCARHLSQWHIESSALALLDGTVHWDMHRPLTENCTLELQNFNVAQPQQVNKAFWRTCSLVLGACATVAFRDNVVVELHSFPGPDIRSGSFTYDVSLPTLPDWQPTEQELRALSAEYVKLVRRGTHVERLAVTEELAAEMFVHNEHKARQIPSIAKANAGKVTLYRIGDHIDISKGPMISNTAQIGRVTVASVHKLTGTSENGDAQQLYRFQGVALPAGVLLNHFAYGILEQRAKKLNQIKSPFNRNESDDSTSEPRSASATA